LPNNPRLNNIQVDFQDFFVHYGICFIKWLKMFYVHPPLLQNFKLQ
jgi:hypothetical protein